MLTFLTIIAIIILGVIGFILGVGIFLLIGFFLVLALIVAAVSFLFGGFHWTSSSSSSQSSTLAQISDDDALEIIDDFHSCLLEADPDPCRKKFTLWDERDKEIIRQLSKQVKDELGKREPNHRVKKIERTEINGEVKVVMEQDSDFAKKKAVKEHYVLESDPKDHDKLKIKDIHWDY